MIQFPRAHLRAMLRTVVVSVFRNPIFSWQAKGLPRVLAASDSGGEIEVAGTERGKAVDAGAKVVSSGHSSRRARCLVAGVLLAVIALISCELWCRYELHLGDPPLVVGDPDIAYYFRPNQTCNRFGNFVHYNAYGMRSDDFTKRKVHRGEFRVMVIGDSVINGGAQTDQRDICTSLLVSNLSREMQRPVVVGNISAGGWGPLNEWPYVRKFGLFDADVVAIVLSSHDASSAFQGTNIAGADADFPDHKPWSATWEAVSRYLPRYLPVFGKVKDSEGYQEPTRDARVERACQDAIREIKLAADRIGAKTAVILHWTQTELRMAQLTPGWRPTGHVAIAETARELNIPVVDLHNAEVDGGSRIFRDDIHPNAAGQRVLEAGIREGVRLVSRPAGTDH